MNIALWIVQGLLALTFVGTGLWKFATPIATLATMIPWAGQVSPGFFYMTAAFDLLGGLGVILPSATRIKPGLTVLANFFLVALSLFVAWGRRSKAPITQGQSAS